jgi:hypothetical protein
MNTEGKRKRYGEKIAQQLQNLVVANPTGSITNQLLFSVDSEFIILQLLNDSA